MKHFKAISILFVAAIALISCCNLFYLVRLYGSIRNSVEKEVLSSISDADLDELWIRAERSDGETRAQAEQGRKSSPNHGEMSAGMDEAGAIVAKSSVNGEVVSEQTLRPEKGRSFNSLISTVIGHEFHQIIDPYMPVDLHVLDSVIVERLNNRSIYPGFVSTEIVDSLGQVVHGAVSPPQKEADLFTYCFHPAGGLSYRVSMTPLTTHIISEMAGVIVTIVLLLVSFSSAFCYLFRTVSGLRTIEEMKDDFVSNMTHELKTPIAIAYSANDALLHYDTENDAAKKAAYLKIANKQLKRLGELVENILAVSMERRKAMTLQPELIRLSPFVEEIAAAQRLRGDKAVTIEVEADGAACVEADRVHLANVLNNLIDNAIKYSGDKVTIAVCADAEGIRVSDNGMGIPSKSLPYLFNKFYRVPQGNRQDVQGYGMGLYYVKSILDRMGWTVSVKSRVGEGSVFTIQFNRDEK